MELRLGSPRPRAHPELYAPLQWPEGRVIGLDAARASIAADLVDILRQRQTRRTFTALPLRALGELLWLTCRTHSTAPSPLGFELQFRPLPSGGAIHPVHLLAQLESGGAWYRYVPIKHALVELHGTEHLATAARSQAAEAVPPGAAVLLALAAEPGKTAAKYHDHESVVWRDAGVVLGFFSLVSETLGLSFCPLGMTGDEFVRPLSEQGKLCGVGLALIGAR